jgi:tetratricopeptide (TPR) repeat protein
MSAPSKNPGKLVLAIAMGGSLLLGGSILVARRMPQTDGAAKAPSGSLEQALKDAGRVQALPKLERACGSAPESCECHQTTALTALDANLAERALEALEKDEACVKQPKSQGMLAEALARVGKAEAAKAQVESVRKRDPKDPYAAYAVAYLGYQQGNVIDSIPASVAAIDYGRGSSARLLHALILYNAGQFKLARNALDVLLKLDPSNVDALYNRALISQKLNQYRDAREGYLKVLKLVPKHADSRFNLGILTHSVGAMAEAKHNLARLKAIVGPGDERVKKLEGLLAGPKPSPAAAMVFGKPSASPAKTASPPMAAGSAPPTP